MEIICGKEKINVCDIKEVTIRKITEKELLQIEINQNGAVVSSQDVFDVTFKNQLEEIFREYNVEIGERLPVPEIFIEDLPTFCKDKTMENWAYQKNSKQSFSIVEFDENGDGIVSWTFEIEHTTDKTKLQIKRIIKLSSIMQIIDRLLYTPKDRIVDITSSKHLAKMMFKLSLIFTAPILLDDGTNDDKEYVIHSYKQIQNDLPNIYKRYIDVKERIDIRNKTKEDFMKKHISNFALILNLNNDTQKIYLDGVCNFDIYEKQTEIVQKIKNN